MRGLLAAATGHLASRGVETARLDAERMLAEVIGTERLELYLEPERVVTDEERAALRELVRRRAAREPAQYILGTAEFYGLEFETDPRALIPRRETELLIDRALEIARDRPVKALDLGAGCGCVAAALAKRLPEGSRVWATDVSREALELARKNVTALGLADRVEFRHGDLFGALRRGADDGAAARSTGSGRRPESHRGAAGIAFDLIVANLPYVESGAFDILDPEVREHEPRIALDGGPDGLDVLRRAARAAPVHMAGGAWLLLEIGFGQAEAVIELVEKAGLEPGRVLSDPANIERVVQGRKPE